jgi:hypothetical protein
MTRAITQPLISALAFAALFGLVLVRGPEGFWDWFGVATGGAGALAFGLRALKATAN